jgi:uncharacterized membrane protein YoaK (UPF0700 family)
VKDESVSRVMAPRGVWRELVASNEHGPLPLLLLALTAVTGLVDAVSILSLGRVFVANMTGNVVFVGFAVAGAPGFSLAASLSALAGFLAGAGVGGVLSRRFRGHRARLLLAGSGFEFACAGVALLVIAGTSSHISPGVQDMAAVLLGAAMGTQNAVVRTLAVPDLTTTVLTLTLTGLIADAHAGITSTSVRRALAVGTMLVGAIVGALLVLKVSPTADVAAACGVLLLAVIAVWRLAGGDRPWHRGSGGSGAHGRAGSSPR